MKKSQPENRGNHTKRAPYKGDEPRQYGGYGAHRGNVEYYNPNYNNGSGHHEPLDSQPPGHFYRPTQGPPVNHLAVAPPWIQNSTWNNGNGGNYRFPTSQRGQYVPQWRTGYQYSRGHFLDPGEWPQLQG